MSTETRNEIQVIPAEVKVVRPVRKIYAYRHCEHEEIITPIVTVPMPKPVYPGSLASPSILAHVMSQKDVDSQPLYRQEQQFARMGPPIVLCDYRPTRGGEHPRNFLRGFSGYLHVDGYSGDHKGQASPSSDAGRMRAASSTKR
jgi:transposase